MTSETEIYKVLQRQKEGAHSKLQTSTTLKPRQNSDMYVRIKYVTSES